MTALRMAWKSFSHVMMSRWRHFASLCQEGDSLYWQAAFDALHAHQVKEDALRWDGRCGRSSPVKWTRQR
ncbi:hypothetical protein ACNKHK_22055 [Shigella flexneri]